MDLTKHSRSQLERLVKGTAESSTEREAALLELASRSSVGIDPPTTNHSRRQSSKYAPTLEQESAVQVFSEGRSAILTAFAGAGKTSTLEMIANSTERRGLYLAFNTVTAAEAQERFPDTVACMTTHALARSGIGERYSSSKLFGSLKPRGLARLHNIKPSEVVGRRIDGLGQAFLVLETIKHFCQSAGEALSLEHVPKDRGQLLGYEDGDLRHARRWVLDRAREFWLCMIDIHDATPMGHDGYLKLWSLGQPQLQYDFILLDEAQDTNPCVMSVLEKQLAQIVYVGDPYQQIYEWRGAMNAMDRVKVEATARLTRTFRFGRDLAVVATDILENLGETAPLTSLPQKQTTIVSSGNPDVRIARKNATLIQEAMQLQDAGVRYGFVGVKDDLLAMVGSVFELKKGKPAKHIDLTGFQTWEDVVAHAQLDEGQDLRVFVGLVERYGERRLYSTLKQACDDDESCDIVLTSGHRAKGREWSCVEVCADFEEVIDGKGRVAESEGRLFYVAITRAKDCLIIDPSLLLRFRQAGRYIPDDQLRAMQEAEAEELARLSATDAHSSPEPSHIPG